MTWKDGKKWVYSICYDEGFVELLKYVVPLHEKYGIPGHLALVAGQIGKRRNVAGSSFNGMQILSADKIKALCRRGWGVSCHGMNHVLINDDNIAEELYRSREVLEQQLEIPVRMFCLPENNSHHEFVKGRAQQSGYDAVMTAYDRVNRQNSDLLSLGRTALHTVYPGPFESEFDPYKRISQAMEVGGWLIDFCHCPRPGKAIDPTKDCSLEELELRFQKILEFGDSIVWPAEPNEVIQQSMNAR